MQYDTLVIQFGPSDAVLKTAEGAYVRRFCARPGKTIVHASVDYDGDDSMVTLNYSDGHMDIYHWYGAIYRSL
jgi:hypothetical protein